MGKTALEKSHSKSSNFKLTMISCLGALGMAAVWIGIALVVNGTKFLGGGLPMLIGGAVALVLSIFLIGKFTR